ncbi:MAG TPA: tetratricopeptide repeat protein [Kofleriaceae bacterium]|nr:tetratricopeptide repeat protein [Kofleriaceae bacterium]
MDTDDSDVGDEFETCLDAARGLLTSNEDAEDLWEANDLCNRALTVRPDSPEAWLVKGQVNSALGDDHSALACIEMSLRSNDRAAETHYWHMAVYADLERFDEALLAGERAFASVDEDDDWLIEEIFFEKGVVLDSMGEHEAALGTFEEGLKVCPESSLLQSGLQPLHRARVRRSFKIIPGGLT